MTDRATSFPMTGVSRIGRPRPRDCRTVVTDTPPAGRLRRQVTWFLPEPVASQVDAVRHRSDPLMQALIAPHVTLVHEAGGIDGATVATAARAVPRFSVRIGSARRWPEPDHGLYL